MRCTVVCAMAVYVDGIQHRQLSNVTDWIPHPVALNDSRQGATSNVINSFDGIVHLDFKARCESATSEHHCFIHLPAHLNAHKVPCVEWSSTAEFKGIQ